MKRFETIVYKDKTIYGQFDFLELLLFKLDVIEGRITEQLYFMDEYGKIYEIDEFGCSSYSSFADATVLLRRIVEAQIKKRGTS